MSSLIRSAAPLGAGRSARSIVLPDGQFGEITRKGWMKQPCGYTNISDAIESVCDPSRPAWAGYYSLGTAGHDFTFDFTASGTYRIYFYFMDNDRNGPKTTRGSTTCAPRRR